MSNQTKEQNIKYYDVEAEVYDKNRYSTLAGHRVDTFHKNILEIFFSEDLTHGDNILEMGCGTGRLLPYMAQKAYKITGIDISQGMLKVARKRLEEDGYGDITLVLDDADSMPFPDNTFDAVYSILVINLIPDYLKAFKEVKRILKPGGLFVFNVPNLNSIYYLGGLYVNMRGKTVTANASGHRYSHWFTKDELTKGLNSIGFVIEDIKGQPPYVRIIDDAAPLNGSILGRMFSKSIYIKARLP